MAFFSLLFFVMIVWIVVMSEKGRMKDRRKESICDGNDNGSNFVLDKAGLGREGTPPVDLCDYLMCRI